MFTRNLFPSLRAARSCRPVSLGLGALPQAAFPCLLHFKTSGSPAALSAAVRDHIRG